MMRRWSWLVLALLPSVAVAEDTVISSKVPKPEVVVVVRRENLDKGFVLDLRETFLPKILEAVELAPF